jgi:hypothetical protein
MSFSSPSPTNYGFEGDPMMEAYMNAKFSEEISEKMKVPKRLTANGQEMDPHEILNGNGMQSWNYYEKHAMTVPDRIVVMGQDQHLGELNVTTSQPSPLSLPRFCFHYVLALFTLIIMFTSPSRDLLCFSLTKVAISHCPQSIFRPTISFCCCNSSNKFSSLFSCINTTNSNLPLHQQFINEISDGRNEKRTPGDNS